MYEDIFESIRQAAEKRNLRERTIQLYCSNVSYFLRCTNKPVTDLSLEDADAFLAMKRLEGRSPETHNHYRSSIKFLYKRVLKITWDDEEVPAMKRERNLPTVLTPQEINAVIESTDNLKHKAIIATMYSSGLRVSEAVRLHYTNGTDIKQQTESKAATKTDKTNSSSAAKAGTSDYRAELQKKYPKLNILTGYSNGTPGSSNYPEKTNVTIAPEFLAKMESDPKLAAEYEKNLADIPAACKWGESMIHAMIYLNDTDIRTIIEAAKEDNAGRANTKQQAGVGANLDLKA